MLCSLLTGTFPVPLPSKQPSFHHVRTTGPTPVLPASQRRPLFPSPVPLSSAATSQHTLHSPLVHVHANIHFFLPSIPRLPTPSLLPSAANVDVPVHCAHHLRLPSPKSNPRPFLPTNAPSRTPSTSSPPPLSSIAICPANGGRPFLRLVLLHTLCFFACLSFRIRCFSTPRGFGIVHRICSFTLLASPAHVLYSCLGAIPACFDSSIQRAPVSWSASSQSSSPSHAASPHAKPGTHALKSILQHLQQRLSTTYDHCTPAIFPVTTQLSAAVRRRRCFSPRSALILANSRHIAAHET